MRTMKIFWVALGLVALAICVPLLAYWATYTRGDPDAPPAPDAPVAPEFDSQATAAVDKPGGAPADSPPAKPEAPTYHWPDDFKLPLIIQYDPPEIPPEIVGPFRSDE